MIDDDKEASDRNWGIAVGALQSAIEDEVERLGGDITKLPAGSKLESDDLANMAARMAAVEASRGDELAWRDVLLMAVSQLFVNIDDESQLAYDLLQVSAICKMWFETFGVLRESEVKPEDFN